MAMPVSVSKPIVGVDVAKNELVIYHAEADLLETIANNKAAIKMAENAVLQSGHRN